MPGVNSEPPLRHAPRVHYGGVQVPPVDAMCLGGQVKIQRLQPFFPDTAPNADLLYFVSSSLPAHWLPAYWNALRDRRRIVWNHSAVSYRAVWPDVHWDDDNMLLEQGMHAADYVIYQSRFAREIADRFLGSFDGPSEVLYNAVDTGHFVPGRSGTVRREPTILLGGTQYRLSSVEIALLALAALRRRIPRARLLVTGSLCWASDVSVAMRTACALAAKLGVADAIEFLGGYTQAEAPRIYGRADLLIHTRYDDLCPNVVIEAMACGLPIVYSRTGGTPELVGDMAGAGVETGHDWEVECFAHPDEWADAIEEVLAAPERYGDAARARAVEHFDLKPWIGRHREIFESVLASPVRGRLTRTPVSETLQKPLAIVELIPSRVRCGERFNTQPDGQSALAIRTANASHATMVALDDHVQDTSFSNPSFVSAAVPVGVTTAAGTRRVKLVELLRESAEADFIIGEADCRNSQAENET